MNGWTFTRIVNKYRNCPLCGASYKTADIKATLESDIITLKCKCGWKKRVNERDEEV